MNKIDIRSSSPAALSLESLGVVTLGKFWDNITLSGDYWRFYYHDSPGAGVIIKGRKREFLPGRCYLLPPACNLESFCNASSEQLFIHAGLSGCRAAVSSSIILLKENFEQAAIDFLRRKILDGQAASPAVRLQALKLMTCALTTLPERFFTAPDLENHAALVRDYINTRLNEDITLTMLAQRAGLSPAALLRLFKRECGVTPYQYLLQQRYNCAAKLLKNSDLTIETICDTVGIKDRFHFSRQFKKLFGMPPAAYRNYYKS